MIVEQIWTANAYRNFNYLIACADTGEALAVDPLDHRKCLAAAKDKGWGIPQGPGWGRRTITSYCAVREVAKIRFCRRALRVDRETLA